MHYRPESRQLKNHVLSSVTESSISRSARERGTGFPEENLTKSGPVGTVTDVGQTRGHRGYIASCAETNRSVRRGASFCAHFSWASSVRQLPQVWRRQARSTNQSMRTGKWCTRIISIPPYRNLSRCSSMIRAFRLANCIFAGPTASPWFWTMACIAVSTAPRRPGQWKPSLPMPSSCIDMTHPPIGTDTAKMWSMRGRFPTTG